MDSVDDVFIKNGTIFAKCIGETIKKTTEIDGKKYVLSVSDDYVVPDFRDKILK